MIRRKKWYHLLIQSKLLKYLDLEYVATGEITRWKVKDFTQKEGEDVLKS